MLGLGLGKDWGRLEFLRTVATRGAVRIRFVRTASIRRGMSLSFASACAALSSCMLEVGKEEQWWNQEELRRRLGEGGKGLTKGVFMGAVNPYSVTGILSAISRSSGNCV